MGTWVHAFTLQILQIKAYGSSEGNQHVVVETIT